MCLNIHLSLYVCDANADVCSVCIGLNVYAHVFAPSRVGGSQTTQLSNYYNDTTKHFSHYEAVVQWTSTECKPKPLGLPGWRNQWKLLHHPLRHGTLCVYLKGLGSDGKQLPLSHPGTGHKTAQVLHFRQVSQSRWNHPCSLRTILAQLALPFLGASIWDIVNEDRLKAIRDSFYHLNAIFIVWIPTI